MIKLFNNGGPWGPWNNGGSNSGNDNGANKNKKPQTEKSDLDIDDLVKKIEDFFRDIFGGKGSNQWQKFSGKTPKSIVGLVIMSFIFFWLALGIYKVNTDENAVILYFGKFYKVATPGLNYAIPYPFGKVIKQSVTTVNTEEFGFNSGSFKNSRQNFDAESLMLTGDENIVDIGFQVQWQISDIENFVFNIVNPNQTIRQVSESSMREIIARTPIADALSDGKRRIEQETKVLLQQTLDAYKAGVRITLVQLRRVDPPVQVIDAFRDVQTAKADKEKEINQAQSYANDIIPRARGTASQMTEQSEAFAEEVVTNAQGEAGRFLAVYKQYAKSKLVTKRRIYLETMEKIYRDADKVIIDKNAARSGVVPYLPLNSSGQVK
jgi:membrane protease subunit HflK